MRWECEVAVAGDDGLYFEDMTVGRILRSDRAIRMDTERIVAFAREFDPHPAHVSEETARHTMFGRLCASGWHTGATTMRLIFETLRVAGGGAGVAVEGLRWARPVFGGDELRVEIEILHTRLSRSRSDAGLVNYKCVTLNQRDEAVQEFSATILMPRRDVVPG
ncbi:MAG TPA: MaoC/PaaZ C-terminal domain-containing protein [Acetobacteraceae bacterium]